MNVESLANAIRETDYLKRFDRHQYAKAFREYGERFGPLYTEAVRAAGAENVQALAAELLEELERGWHRQKIWNRSAAQINEKQIIVTFLSPMLLQQEESLCRELAKALRDVWNARRPKDPYRIASFEKLAKGFRNTILGIDIGSFQKSREEEADEEDL